MSMTSSMFFCVLIFVVGIIADLNLNTSSEGKELLLSLQGNNIRLSSIYEAGSGDRTEEADLKTLPVELQEILREAQSTDSAAENTDVHNEDSIGYLLCSDTNDDPALRIGKEEPSCVLLLLTPEISSNTTMVPPFSLVFPQAECSIQIT